MRALVMALFLFAENTPSGLDTIELVGVRAAQLKTCLEYLDSCKQTPISLPVGDCEAECPQYPSAKPLTHATCNTHCQRCAGEQDWLGMPRRARQAAPHTQAEEATDGTVSVRAPFMVCRSFGMYFLRLLYQICTLGRKKLVSCFCSY